MTAHTPSIMMKKTHKVIFAPPNRSASHPPSGRMAAPSNGPIQAYCSGRTSGYRYFTSSGNPAEKPINDPNVPRYSKHMVQVCPRLKMTACWANDALAPAMSCMAAHAINDNIPMHGTQLNATFSTTLSHDC